RGIRTPGGVTLNGFQDRRIRPLCHLSEMFAVAKVSPLATAKLYIFFVLTKFYPAITVFRL
ncbi:MAG: hypothetical protein J1E97_08620, partial [Muribaculaceae bacterium]|nr:hypothetical protein [Muribaculaceae bacterium]